MFSGRETQRLLISNKENLELCLQSTPIEDGKFDFNDTMTSLSEKFSWSVTESTSESENQNSSSNYNEMLPDSPIRRKRKQQCIQHLCAEEYFEEEPPESFKKT